MRFFACAGVVLLAIAAAGCGGTESRDGSGPGQRAGDRTLVVGQFSWSAARVTIAILQEVVRRHPELGVRRVDVQDVTPEQGWSRLADGRLDVLPEVFLPNQYEYFADAQPAAELVHRTYAGAVNAWYVPAYTVEPGGVADGLSSVAQLAKYADVFGRTLYDGEPGWVTTTQNAERIEGFKLDLEHETGSEEELLAELERRYNARRPILLYLWRPHWAHAAFDLVELREPNGYSVNCFEGDRKACAMPTNDVWVAARKDLDRRFPRFSRLLNRFEVPLADIESMLAKTERDGRPSRAVAREWIDEHAADVAGWVAR